MTARYETSSASPSDPALEKSPRNEIQRSANKGGGRTLTTSMPPIVGDEGRRADIECDSSGERETERRQQRHLASEQRADHRRDGESRPRRERAPARFAGGENEAG